MTDGEEVEYVVPVRNRALESLVTITGFLLIGGVICIILVNILVGIIAVCLGLVMGVITLVTKAIVNGRPVDR